MSRTAGATTLPLLALTISLYVTSCSQPPPEPDTVAGTSKETSGEDAWQVACVVAGSAAAPSDSAAPFLAAAAALWESERTAFRAYQRSFCDDCAMFETSALYFFASSTNLVTRIAQRYPRSASAACAEGMMHWRNSSRGEGNFDASTLDQAVAAFRRALSLNPSTDLAERIRADLADLEELRSPR